MKETNAQKLRRLRAAAALEGKCYVCRLRKPRPRVRSCDKCLKNVADRKIANAYIKCVNCCAPLPKRSQAQRCAKCSDEASQRNRQRRLTQAALGLCHWMRCPDKPHPGLSACLKHAEYSRIRALTRGRLAGARPRTCTVPGCGATGHDRRTHDRYTVLAKAWSA